MNNTIAWEALRSTAAVCALPNWDGYNAEPVQGIHAAAGAQFLASLPDDMEAPEISADPDGHLSFEWYSKEKNVCTVSVSPSLGLAYAWIKGEHKQHGAAAGFEEMVQIIQEFLKS